MGCLHTQTGYFERRLFHLAVVLRLQQSVHRVVSFLVCFQKVTAAGTCVAVAECQKNGESGSE